MRLPPLRVCARVLPVGRDRTDDAPPVASARDPRAPKAPLYSHTTIHSDDITTLGFAPASLHSLAFPLDPADEVARAPPATSAVLLSGSTDGTLSLTDAREQDEDEAQLGVANVGVSVAEAGWSGGGWDVWGRDDMDGVSVWDAADVRLPSLLLTPDGAAETDGPSFPPSGSSRRRSRNRRSGSRQTKARRTPRPGRPTT